jgi:hypothetical protein
MIAQSVKNPDILDRIHVKCQGIETNIKNFKLKSKATFQSLIDEEQLLSAELSAFEDKLESVSYAQ